METEALKRCAADMLKQARDELSEHHRYFPQLLTLDADGQTNVYVLADSPVRPADLIRGILRRSPVVAFIFCGEAWLISRPNLPGEKPGDSMRRLRNELPESLADYKGSDRRECLMMWVASRDYTAMHAVSVTRHGDDFEFGKEVVMTDLNKMSGSIVDMRDLLNYLH